MTRVPCGLRDYGTGAWDGGDPDCDHRSPTMREGRNEDRAKLAGSDATNAAQLLLAHRTGCGKCGATKVDHQLGLEPTPDAYVTAMVDVFREVRRVLRHDGTCWVNLGDSYHGGGGGNYGDSKSTRTHAEHLTNVRNRIDLPGLKPKDLVGIPWRVAFALQTDGWYLRSDIIWSKPNPMPESVTDRPTKAHEYLFLLTKSPRYYFDQEAVREPHTTADRKGDRRSYAPGSASSMNNGEHQEMRGSFAGLPLNPAGRNLRSVWEIATQPYPEAHFATFPEALPERCIKAGTSERGCCPECGAPWERVVEREPSDWQERRANGEPVRHGLTGAASHGAGGFAGITASTRGWRATCQCGSTHVSRTAPFPHPVPCTVLDPFMGSGTTAHVARKLGRRSIGIELNPEYAELCARRLQQQSLFA